MIVNIVEFVDGKNQGVVGLFDDETNKFGIDDENFIEFASDFMKKNNQVVVSGSGSTPDNPDLLITATAKTKDMDKKEQLIHACYEYDKELLDTYRVEE